MRYHTMHQVTACRTIHFQERLFHNEVEGVDGLWSCIKPELSKNASASQG